MIKTQAINHELRRMLGIGTIHYLIADLCAQHHHIYNPTSIASIAEELGLSTQGVGKVCEELRTCQPALLEVAENGSIYPTRHWYLAQFADATRVSPEKEGLARDVVIYFNEVNGTKFQLPNNIQLVNAILKVMPKLTLEHFQSIILHKLETWGKDPKMAEYNRPSTLFRSARQFQRYLDEATHYWNQQRKQAIAK